MTLNRLFERDRHFSDQPEIGLEHIAGLNGQRDVAGAGGHDLTRFQRHAKLTQFVGEPCQSNPGVTKHVLSMTGELLSPQRNDRFLLHEIERAPVRRRWRTEHEQVRACIVRDDLRGSALTKSANLESGISIAG